MKRPAIKKTNPAHLPEAAALLRRQAEARLNTRYPDTALPESDGDVRRLLHELQVHQVELELQNDELQKARDEMEAWLEQYSDLYEFAPVGYFTLTRESAIRQVNLTGATLVGIERSRLVGQLFARLVTPELGPAFHSFLKQVFAAGTRQSFELAFLRRGQPPLYVNVEAQRTPKGEECRAAVMDITARKQAEDKVRVSEIRYRRLFEATHDGVLLLDPVTRKIVDANPFMTKLLGYPNDQLVGKELFEIGLLKDKVGSQEMFRKLKRDREVRYEDLPLESRRGRHQEVEVVANLYQEDGHAVIQCNIRDITERKQAKEALSASEERFRAAVGIVSSLIWTNNAEGLMAGEQPGWGNFTGQTKKQYQGHGWSKAVHPEDAQPTLIAWKRALANKSLFEFEHRLRRRDGEWRLCSVHATPLLGADGMIREWVGVHTDITDRKRVEETRRRLAVLTASNRKLEAEIVRRQAVETSLKQSEQHQIRLVEQSLQMQERLRQLSRQILSAQEEERKRISRELHDVIAQTLTGINIQLAALAKGAALNAKGLDRSIARTREQVGKSVDLVHEFARELRPAVLDDLGLIPALHSFAKIFSKRTRVHVRLTAFAGVEALDDAKRTALFRVAQEALTNVSRHAQASRVKITIQKRAAGIGMKIHDNGKSFSVEQKFQGNGGKRLGLLGMSERVEAIGGTFRVESAPGRGTCIEVMIPSGKAPPPRSARRKKNFK